MNHNADMNRQITSGPSPMYCRLPLLVASSVTLLCGAGCVDGPLYNLKRINPYYTSQWEKDREHGPTYEDRYNELIYASQRLKNMAPGEQQKWARTLADVIKNDPSAEMRAKAVRAIASVEDAVVTEALNLATIDESEKVRVAACEAWKQQAGSAARDMLLSVAKSEEETASVRQQAIASLESFGDAEVLRTFDTLLDDQSPVIQYQVAQTLRNVSGEDFGGDIAAWKQYIASSTATTAPANPSAGGMDINTDPPSLLAQPPVGSPTGGLYR